MNGPLQVQIGGGHYKTMPIQPAEFCHANKLGFLESSVIKYVCRHNLKGKRTDLEKAKHFIELLIHLEYDSVQIAETPPAPRTDNEQIERIYGEIEETGETGVTISQLYQLVQEDPVAKGTWFLAKLKALGLITEVVRDGQCYFVATKYVK